MCRLSQPVAHRYSGSDDEAGRFGCWQEARSVGTHVLPAHADITFPVRGMASWWLLRMPAHTVDSR